MQMLEEPHGRFDDPDEELDEIYEILGNRRRRIVLRYLNEKRRANLSDMAREIAAIENKKSVGQVDESEGGRMYIALYQVHLPRLEEANIVEVDEDNDVRIKKDARKFLEYMPSQAEGCDSIPNGALSDV